jgi:hypothetical protein
MRKALPHTPDTCESQVHFSRESHIRELAQLVVGGPSATGAADHELVRTGRDGILELLAVAAGALQWEVGEHGGVL